MPTTQNYLKIISKLYQNYIKLYQNYIKIISNYIKIISKLYQNYVKIISKLYQNYIKVTLEDANYTVRLCERGFSIVAHQLDSVHWEGETVYETPHSLLDNISMGYRQAFGDDLSSKLAKLKERRESMAELEGPCGR